MSQTDFQSGPEPAQETGGVPYVSPADQLRIVEALLFASAQPLRSEDLATHLPAGADIAALLATLTAFYAPRGVNLVRVAGGYAFRTADDLAPVLVRQAPEERKLSRASLESLAIVAYHQPVTRGEIEDIRGVKVNRGTLDVLLELGWIRIRGRRKSPGRPVTYGTTPAFLDHFGLEAISDLPGLDDLQGAGFIDAKTPSSFAIPSPDDDPALRDDEEPEDQAVLDLGIAPAVDDGQEP